MITFRVSAQFDKQTTIILADESQVKSKKLNGISSKEITAVIESKQFSGKDGEIFPLINRAKLILLTGIGDTKKLSLTALRITVRKALLSSYLRKLQNIEIIPHQDSSEIITAIIEGFIIGTYSWKKYRAKAKDDQTVDNKNIFLVAQKKKAYDDAIKICEGTNLTRDLINDNADVVTSDFLEKIIRGLIKGKKNISITVLNKKELKAKGLGLHLAVNQASPKEPKLIIVNYHGSSNKGNYTALVGKGITFDTGGLNLKPTGSMETMRMDMSGAAAVIGTLKAAIDLDVKKNVLFVCAIAENTIDALSYKPGDVIRGFSGKTVEIGNTDAEGRLVLADAISYVVKNYKPARMIDIATLTGACVVALGHDYAGLVTTDDKFSRQLVHSSNETDDRVWRLPSYPELKDSVKSKIADIRNTGVPKGAGGAITAAEFLRQFTDDTPWAHLDIAGTAFVEGEGRMYFSYGATGFGVRLFTHFLQNH